MLTKISNNLDIDVHIDRKVMAYRINVIKFYERYV